MLTIGQIAYANCTPIFTALKGHFDCSGYRFVKGVPAHLNGMLCRGEVDVCPSSSYAYALAPDRYFLLPELSISSVGAVKSVLLFSRVPLDELDNLTIGLTGESATSVNLLRIILAKQHGFRNDFRTCDLSPSDAMGTVSALLLIGDAALRWGREADGFHVYDLGELWYRFTGLPFVFALWMVAESAVREHRQEVRLLARNLVAAKQLAYGSYGEIADSCSDMPWITAADLADYWRTISYDLTEDHLAGVRLFYRYAAELGMLRGEPEIRLFD